MLPNRRRAAAVDIAAPITVAVPWCGRHDYLRECVKSLQQQTRPVTVMVICDGVPVPGWLAYEPDVVAYSVPENRGAYYCRAVALAAARDPWHGVVDSDDYVAPGWAEGLLRRPGWTLVHEARIDHHLDGTESTKLFRRAHRAASKTLTHTTSHIGIHWAERLRSVGGYHPGFRVGYDTMLMALLTATGPIHVTRGATYHRRIRPGSLTQSEATDHRSALRLQTHRVLSDLYAEAWKIRTDVPRVRALVESTWPAELAAEVAYHAQEVWT